MKKHEERGDYIPTFIGVFEQKLDMMKRRIKRELDKPKKERNTHELKKLLAESQSLKKLIKKVKRKSVCPHCGEEL